tara:strand:- start:226 stop:426 length:201 start_codon:yes stop_codon:yes gene_type:complete
MNKSKPVSPLFTTRVDNIESVVEGKEPSPDPLPLTAQAFDEFCKQATPKEDRISLSAQCVLGKTWS